MDNIHETTKEIKKSLRLAMNGIVSAHQRNQGLNYKINFGVEIPRLKEIAQRYPQNKELALALWGDNIRECKLLAIMLLPPCNYSEVATEWIAQTPFTEVADHLSKTILCKLPLATAKAIEWTGNPEGFFGYCGYLTLNHLLRDGASLTTEQEEIFYKNATELANDSPTGTLTRYAVSAVTRYIEESAERAARLAAATPEGSALHSIAVEYCE